MNALVWQHMNRCLFKRKCTSSMLADRLHAPAGTRLRCHIKVHVSGAPVRVRWGVHVEAISIRWGGVVRRGWGRLRRACGCLQGTDKAQRSHHMTQSPDPAHWWCVAGNEEVLLRTVCAFVHQLKWMPSRSRLLAARTAESNEPVRTARRRTLR